MNTKIIMIDNIIKATKMLKDDNEYDNIRVDYVIDRLNDLKIYFEGVKR